MWRRALAFLIDLIPLGLLALIQNALGIESHPLVGLFNLVFFLSYFAGMDYFYGGTLGKRLLGLRVALLASPNVGGLLLLRALVKLFALFPPFGTAYALTAIWRKDGRSLGDLAVGSAVIEVVSIDQPEKPSLIGRIFASLLAIFAPFIFLTFLVFVLLGWVIAAIGIEVLSEILFPE